MRRCSRSEEYGGKVVDDVGQESPTEPGVGFGQDAAGVVFDRVHRRALVSPFLSVKIRGGHEAVENGFAYLELNLCHCC